MTDLACAALHCIVCVWYPRCRYHGGMQAAVVEGPEVYFLGTPTCGAMCVCRSMHVCVCVCVCCVLCVVCARAYLQLLHNGCASPGIIDVLQKWNQAKRVERWFKISLRCMNPSGETSTKRGCRKA
mgnify:CR=1 FL=1